MYKKIFYTLSIKSITGLHVFIKSPTIFSLIIFSKNLQKIYYFYKKTCYNFQVVDVNLFLDVNLKKKMKI